MATIHSAKIPLTKLVPVSLHPHQGVALGSAKVMAGKLSAPFVSKVTPGLPVSPPLPALPPSSSCTQTHSPLHRWLQQGEGQRLGVLLVP